jgi:lipid-A-disaccharide synthase
MKIFVSAAEISSDIHAEKILKSIQKKLLAENVFVQWMGIGGPKVSALPGFVTIESAENLRTMGFVEVLKKFSFFKKLIIRSADEIKKFDPDLILTFDYPDFHFRLMKLVVENGLAPRALRICGIPPKVWVWRSKRIEKIRQYYDGAWVIFPFEKNFYESKGIPVIYEGNPLLEDLFEEKVGIIHKKPLETITLMPGSRDSEIEHHLPVMREAVEMFSNRIGKKVTAQVPLPIGIDIGFVKERLKNTENVEYIFLGNDSAKSLKETQIGLIKSGTSTLEATVLDCIPVIFYKMNWLSEQVFRYFIKGWNGYVGPVGLPNILLGVKKRSNSFFAEYLGPEASAEKLSGALYQLYSDSQLRLNLLLKCKEIRNHFFIDLTKNQSSDISAEKIINWKKNPPQSSISLVQSSSLLLFFVSIAWSSLNWLRRRLVQLGLFTAVESKIPSIIVGNLQAGGSGKTPLVIALAKEAVRRGKKVAVISRGYGSNAKNPLGDEPLEIKTAVPEVMLSVNANRIMAIKAAEEQGVDLMIFDDGFQNLKFKSKINLIAVTDRNRCEVAFRDFDSEIKFADFVIGTKGSKFRDIYTAHANKFYQIVWKWDNPTTSPVWILCGIADPVELVSFYRAKGLVIKNIITKPDHAEFREEEVKKLMEQAKADGCILAMTEKDIVKIHSLSSFIYVLKRSIQNHDWIDAVFESKLYRDESP